MNVKRPIGKTQAASKLVNLDTYTKDTHLIIAKAPNDKTYIGRVYQMSPLVGGGSEFGTVLRNIIKTAPDDTVIQVNLICEPDDEAPNIFATGKNHGGDVVQELIARQVKLLSNATEIGWQGDVPLLNIKTVITSIAIPVRNTPLSILEDEGHRHEEIFSSLKSCGFYDARPLNAGELASHYRHVQDLFEPSKPAQLDELVDYKQQIFGPDQLINFEDRRVGVMNEKTFVTTVTCKSFPEYPFHGLMNLVSGAPLNAGPTKDGGGERILTPFIINTTIRVANQRKEWTRIDSAIESRLKVEKKLPFQLGNEDPAVKLADLQLIKRQCSEADNKFVYVSTSAFLYGKTREEAIRAAGTLKTTMDKLGFDARTVLDNALPRWTQMLPMNFSPKLADELQTEGLMSASAAAYLLPVMADYTGNVNRNAGRTGVPFITRRGMLHLFDMFVSNGNFSGVICATPGSGKSVAAQYIVEMHLAQGDDVIVLDNGKSFKKFCHAVGGEYNEFGTNGFKPSLNPFTGLNDEEFDEQQETITSLIALMAYEGKDPENGGRIALSEAVKAAYGQKRWRADIQTVIDCLKSIQTSGAENVHKNEVVIAAGNLIPRLKAFIDSPTRGSYFRGAGTIDPKKQFTCFELSGLGDDQHLKTCVLFFVLNVIMSRIRKKPGVRKFILVDESHDLLEEPAVAKALDGLYLKGRKDKVAIWVVVQSLLKLHEIPAGPVILNQSNWKLILAQVSEEIDIVIDRKIMTAFASDPYFSKLIRSVETVKGHFSEVMIMGPKSYEVARLYLDKFTSTLFSSEGDARDTVLEMMENGTSAIDAVKTVMNDKKERRLGHMRTLINHIKNFDNLTSKDILDELKELL